MLLKTLRENFHTGLKELYPDTEIRSFFGMLSECYLKLKGVDVALNLYMPISGKKIEKFDTAINRLKNYEPIQYIIGATEFYGLPFKVTESTLIPRPETEELVEWIINAAGAESQALSILDIGTGTGCIAVSLARHLPKTECYAVDISKKALTVAKTNAKLNKVNVKFEELDILNWNTGKTDGEFDQLKFDLIVSNPPYVRQLEKAAMSPNVLRHEPALALYVEDDDPLIFYRTIVDFAMSHLNQNGRLFFEINQYLGPQMHQLLDDSGFKKIELKTDIFGNDRMISAIHGN